METFGEGLVAEFFDRIQSYVRLRVPAQDCEDVAADIFLRAIERQEQLRGDAGAWLFAIARSRVAEHYREKDALMRTDLSTSSVDGADPPALAGPPLESLEQAEFREMLQRKMQVLSGLERDVIAFKFTDGLTNTEIAQVLDMAPNHLGVVLHRALQKLRRAMLEA